MSEIKVTEQELTRIKELQENYFKITYELGQIAIDKADLKKKLAAVEETEEITLGTLGKLKITEEEISKELLEKYGSSTIDLETGVIK